MFEAALIFFGIFIGQPAMACYFDFPCDLDQLIVKIESNIKGDPSKKIEGTGFLIRDPREGRIHVLTSEHVVFPCDEEAEIIITDSYGYYAKGKIAHLDWMSGLALIRPYGGNFFEAHRWAPSPAGAGERFLFQYGDPKPGEVYGLSTLGFAKGSHELSSLSTNGENYRSRIGKGLIAVNSEALVIENLGSSPGISGSPVFNEQSHFVGVVSHQDPKTSATYVLPSSFVKNWLEHDYLNRHPLNRSCADAILGRDGTVNKIVGDNGHEIIVKNDQVLAVRNANATHDLFYNKNGLDNLFSSMKFSNIQTAELCCWDKQPSLVRVIHDILRSSENYKGIKRDAEIGEDGINYRIKNFVPTGGQYVTYRTSSGTVKYSLDKYEKWPQAVNVEWTDEGRNTEWDKFSLPYDDMWSTEKWRTLRGNCEFLNGGRLEILSTPIGKIPTCSYIDEASPTYRVWKGPVPIFGIVKKESLDGKQKFELLDVYYSSKSEVF